MHVDGPDRGAGMSAVALEKRAREGAYRMRYLLNAYPVVYRPLAWIRHRDQDDWSVRRDTELTIEGVRAFGQHVRGRRDRTHAVTTIAPRSPHTRRRTGDHFGEVEDPDDPDRSASQTGRALAHGST